VPWGSNLEDIQFGHFWPVRLRPHPTAGLVRSAYPVGSIWAAHQTQGLNVKASAEAVLLTRLVPGVKVTVAPVPMLLSQTGYLVAHLSTLPSKAH